MKIINISQNTPEWKEFRKMKIGSSMASAIMDMNPWQSPLQLWESIINGEEKIPNASMIRGSQLESSARDWVNRTMNSTFKPIVCQYDEYAWLIASLDGWNGKQVLEIKCPGSKDHVVALGGKIPEHYKPQLQHQLMVTDAQSGYYCSFDGTEGMMIPFERDESFIETLLDAEVAFYESLIQFIPPEPTERDIVEIQDPILIHKATNYAKILEQIELLEGDLELLKKDLIKGAGSPRAKIANLKLTKVVRKGAVNYEAIPQLQGVNLDAYRKKPVESWRITTD